LIPHKQYSYGALCGFDELSPSAGEEDAQFNEDAQPLLYKVDLSIGFTWFCSPGLSAGILFFRHGYESKRHGINPQPSPKL
jgi:hypothetical protein